MQINHEKVKILNICMIISDESLKFFDIQLYF